MTGAKDIVEKYNARNRVPVSEVKLSESDLKAKAIVESLIENKFSVDIPTKKDAVSEILKLAESTSPIAKKMMEIFDDVCTNCSVDESGNITLKKESLKTKW